MRNKSHVIVDAKVVTHQIVKRYREIQSLNQYMTRSGDRDANMMMLVDAIVEVATKIPMDLLDPIDFGNALDYLFITYVMNKNYNPHNTFSQLFKVDVEKLFNFDDFEDFEIDDE